MGPLMMQFVLKQYNIVTNKGRDKLKEKEFKIGMKLKYIKV
jgi:hypothetical protein